MDKLVPIIVGMVGILLLLIPQNYLLKLSSNLLKNFGLKVETKKVSLSKFVTEMIRYTGAVLIAVAIIMFFVLPFYSMVSDF